MKPVDLHTHSTRSDGTCTPSELVNLAKEKGLAAFALTDHDNVNGIDEAMKAAQGTDIEVIPGIELSTKYGAKDVHIVGLYFNYTSPEFQEEVKRFSNAREIRNRKMCDNMCKAGLPIPYDELVADNPGAVITRANMAKFLLKKGAVSSINEAFEKYIGDDCPFFIPRDKITPQIAIEFIRRYDGIPVLAHPFQYNLGDAGLEKLIDELKSCGLMGIEAYYCTHTKEMTQKIQTLAKSYHLLLSGGSDFHGKNKPGLEMGTGYGNLFVPEDCLTKIKHARFHITEQTKIFFCDFDGTLANEERNISPETRASLDAFVARGKTQESSSLDASQQDSDPTHPSCQGNVFVLSSGRAMSDVKNLAKRLHLDYPNLFLSGYNGAEIYSCETKTTFFRETVPFDVVKEVMQLSREYGLYCQTYDEDEIVVPEWGKETDYYTSRVKMSVRVDPFVRIDPRRVLSKEPCKCLVIHLENEEDHRILEFSRIIEEKFGGIVRTILSNPWYLEIDPVRATKGNALHWLCRHLGIEHSSSIAAGDAPNDNTMIKEAGVGIGMCNGLATNPQMAEIADFITEADNNHDGLAPILDKL